MPRHLLLLVLLPVFVLLVGCKSIRSFPGIPPEVSLVNMTLEDVAVMETNSVFTIRVDNENPEPIFISGATHRIYINNEYVGKGLSNKQIKVEPLTSYTEEVSVNLGNLAMVRQFQDIQASRRASYRLESIIYIKYRDGNFAVKTEKEDFLDFNAFLPKPAASSNFAPTPIAPGSVPASTLAPTLVPPTP